jgi:hypothetical protein
MPLHQLLASLPAGDEFTAALTSPETAGAVSAIIATYNRCPFSPASGRLRDNPLTWALDSLLSQAGDALAEIIVADDGSADHTSAVLDTYTARPGPVPVRVVRLPGHRGAWAARNTAAQMARARWLLFGDDDCVFAPRYAAGAAYALQRLRSRDTAAAAVMLPFYYRAVRPAQTAPVSQIGRLRPHLAQFATRFHTWPRQYLPAAPRLGGPGVIIAPLRVQLIGGTAIVAAGALAAAGGFTDLSAWPASYSDHLHLSADLTGIGGHLYHCPDPRLSAVHLKFGAAGRYPACPADMTEMLPGTGRRLGELAALAATPRTATGCRVPDASFHAEMIGSFFAFFAGRSPAGGLAWGVRTWRDFVEAGRVYSLAVAAAPARPDRERAWREGLRRGARFLAGAARPGLRADQVRQVLDGICRAVHQPQVSGW